MRVIGWFLLGVGLCGLAAFLQMRYYTDVALPEKLKQTNLVCLIVSLGIAIIGEETIRHARKK